MSLPLRGNCFKQRQMKQILRLLCMMLLAPMALASCLKDNDTQVEAYSDTAITAVTLGALNR